VDIAGFYGRLVSKKPSMRQHPRLLSHIVVLSHTVTMVSHKFALNCKFALSCQALFRVAPVVSQRTCGGCGRTPQPWHDYDTILITNDGNMTLGQ